jgi:hypothetical protein
LISPCHFLVPFNNAVLTVSRLLTHFPWVRTALVVSDFRPRGLPVLFGVYCFSPSSNETPRALAIVSMVFSRSRMDEELRSGNRSFGFRSLLTPTHLTQPRSFVIQLIKEVEKVFNHFDG